MNTIPESAPDPELRALLRAAHPAPDLPPRFQAGVWRRLERTELPKPAAGWFEVFVAGLLRPAYAGIGLAAVMMAGAWLGSRDADLHSRQAEQLRYLAAVSPLRPTL